MTIQTPQYWEQAARELAERDIVIRGLVERFQGLAMGSRGDAFSTLARSIVGQQISVKAAQSVWERVHKRFDGVSPAALACCSSRACTIDASAYSASR